MQKHIAWALCAALGLAAGCGGKTKGKNGITEPTVVGTAERMKDPAFAARAAHVNQGGMWMPQQLPAFGELFKKLGVETAAETLSDPLAAPLAAVVSLGGCTASFVSPEGLIVTNHHCVQGGLQFNSTPAQNLVELGFLAKTKADEKWIGPAGRVWVAQAFKDVTTDVLGGLDKIADHGKRYQEMEKRNKSLIAACEKDRPEVRCRLHAYFRGTKHFLAEYIEIRDVRLVHAPARAIGNYGGEIDNWEWPRHTGDYSFYRAYVGKDGKPADFANDNVPFQPKHWLKIGTEGVSAADFVMVTGYPGRTNRLQTAAELAHDIEWTHPRFIEQSKQKMAILEQFTLAAADPKATEEVKAAGIKATVQKQMVQNFLEKYEGMMAGFAKNDTLAAKRAMEKTFLEWTKADPARQKYADALAQIDAQFAAGIDADRADEVFYNTLGGSRMLSTAMLLARMADERPKKDEARKPGLQARDLPMIEGRQVSLTKQYDRSLDRAMFKLALQNAAKEPEALRPWLAPMLGLKKGAVIDDKAIDTALDGFYAATKLEDEATRLTMLKTATAKQLTGSKNPFVRAALVLKPVYLASEKASEAQTAQAVLPMAVYMEGLLESLGGTVAPDANSSLRVSFGTVRGYKPDVAKAGQPETYPPFTMVSQILTKDTGKEPFDAPAGLLKAIKAGKWGPYASKELGEVPVNFLSDLDITGGNSGSPILNGKGQLIGLAFDGNIEGMASDVVFNPVNTRTIGCDIRYVLWVMDAVDQADHLLAEMGVTPSL